MDNFDVEKCLWGRSNGGVGEGVIYGCCAVVGLVKFLNDVHELETVASRQGEVIIHLLVILYLTIKIG